MRPPGRAAPAPAGRDARAGAVAAPRAWVLCARLGAVSEPWIWRQVVGFRRLVPELVVGRYECPERWPLDGVTVHRFPPLANGQRGWRRWPQRALNAPTRNWLALDPLRSRELAALARRRRPAVALCHFGHVALRAMGAARRAGLPVVVHFHGLDLSSSLHNRWYRWSLAECLRHCAGAVVVGEHQRRWLLEHGVPAQRVHLVPCGVPVGDYTPRRHAGTDAVRFVTVSRLVESKGVHVSLRAFARVAAVLPGARLAVVGDGPMRPRLERLAAELGVAGAVEFDGDRDTNAVRDRLAAADVFLQHSLDHDGWTEGFGVSITEASASGLPVVVSRCGGIVDQVVDGCTGLLVAQHDVQGMAEHMLRLAGDPALRQRLGAAGRARARERYDTARQVERLEDVLLDVARAPAVAPG